MWIADHTKLNIFVKTTQNPDGTWNSKRVWLTGIIDAATNALVGYVPEETLKEFLENSGFSK